jgi:predicted metal-dependent hydrolase
MTYDWTQGELAEGLRRYNAGEYFGAHESWELVWLAAPTFDKPLLQGLIQVTAAFEHQRRNNPLGTRRLLQNALRRLGSYPPDFGNLALAQLRDDIRDRLTTLTAAPTATSLTPARIHPL